MTIDINYVDYLNENINRLYEVEGSTIAFSDRKYIEKGSYKIKTYKLEYKKRFETAKRIDELNEERQKKIIFQME